MSMILRPTMKYKFKMIVLELKKKKNSFSLEMLKRTGIDLPFVMGRDVLTLHCLHHL